MSAGFEEKPVHGVVQIQEHDCITRKECIILLLYHIFPLCNELTADSTLECLLYGTQLQVEPAETVIPDFCHIDQGHGCPALWTDFNKSFILEMLQSIADRRNAYVVLGFEGREAELRAGFQRKAQYFLSKVVVYQICQHGFIIKQNFWFFY